MGRDGLGIFMGKIVMTGIGTKSAVDTGIEMGRIFVIDFFLENL
jgi:hypothetical protein